MLRIISMLFIVMHHYAYHGGFVLDPNTISINKVIVQFLSAGGKLGVNCFILITGYFMIKSTFKFDKLLKLLFTIFTYSVLIYIISLLAGFVDFNFKQAVKSFFPVIFNQYWFATSYVLLYIFSPYINSLISAIDRKKHLNLIVLLITVWSIVPTIVPVDLNFSSIGWFATLYIIAAYIRMYPNFWLENLNINKILFLFSYSIILITIIFFDIIGTKFVFFANNAMHFTNMNMLPLLLCSVFLFLWFKNMDIKSDKCIKFFSSSMFGVYLIHDNSIIRNILWKDFFKNDSFFYSDYMIIHALLVITVVFLSCVIVEKAHKYIIAKQASSVIEKISINLLEVLTYSKLFLFEIFRRLAGLAEESQRTPR